MASEGANTSESAGSTDPGRILLFVAPGRDRELLVETLGDRHRMETTTDPEALEGDFDCCVLDAEQFNRVADRARARTTAADAFLPLVLLVDDDRSVGPAVWEYVDDVVEIPVARAALTARVENLLDRRRTALELADRTTALEATVSELRLKERAIDAAPVGFSITDPDLEDNPLVYVNEAFETTTGYDAEEVVGRNCRFLQGEDTDPETVDEIRAALDAERPVSVDILNYRSTGQKFWNSVDISPIRDEDGTVTNYVGFQTDITERKIRERRLEVFNRVLSHNLRNKMNVVEGRLDLLREAIDGEPPDHLDRIEAAVADLLGLADTVRRIEQTVDTMAPDATVDLADHLPRLVAALRSRYPDAEVTLSLPSGDSCVVAVPGLMTAVEEVIDNAIVHNDDPSPTVDVRVTRPSPTTVDVTVADDGPGIPDRELVVLDEGESPLQHADRLGLWLVYWVVSRVGGDLTVEDAEPTGTVLTLTVPVGPEHS